MSGSVKVKVRIGEQSGANADDIQFDRLRLRAWIVNDPPKLIATLRLSMKGAAEITGVPDNLPHLEVEITDSSGRSLFGPETVKIDQGNLIVQLDPSVAERIPQPPPPRQKNRSRHGHFRVLFQAAFRFDRQKLAVLPVTRTIETELRRRLPDHQPSADGWVAVGNASKAALRGLQLESAKLGFDGAFSLEFEPQSEIVGWIFAISGWDFFLGFVPDDMQREIIKDITIFLPIDVSEPADATEPVEPETPAAEPVPTTPIDATETEILDNPELFSDDPGTSCQPFTNPERILGERRFQTILRSEQPEVFDASQSKFKELPEFITRQEFTADDKSRIAAGLIADRHISVSFKNAGLLKHIEFAEQIKRRGGREAPGVNTLIEWEGGALRKQAITIAGGHILEWSVRWRSNGYSLGSVNHTLTLAPRQIKRIVKIEYARSERARRQEVTTVDDEVSQETNYTRDYTDAVKSNLSEWAKGASQSAAAGAGVGAGGLIGNAVVGGGAAAGGAVSASQQAGGRTAAAVEEQNLRDAIRQHGESLRQLESTVITEVDQRETTEGVSEIIGNQNYCHALTVVYYDILRHLRVDTELAGVSECLFVPFAVTPFAIVSENVMPGRIDVRRVIRHRDSLLSALKDRKLSWVFPYLEDYASNFVFSSIPDGRRMDQDVVSLRGSIDMRISVASPLRGDEDAQARQAAADSNADELEIAGNLMMVIGAVMTPFQGLGIAVAATGAALAAVGAHERERLFETEIAPTMAVGFVNKLRLFVGNVEVRADFTMQGNYRKGGVHRVHFQVSRAELERRGLTRADLEEIRIRAPLDDDFLLPNYSVANVTGGRIQVSTETYRKTLTDSGIHDDVIEQSSNAQATKAVRGSAILNFPASSWEKENLRLAIRDDIERLVRHLDSHLFYYHKAIWWQMDPDELFTILDGYTLSPTDHRSIASLVEYRPLAVMGNTLAFRVARGAFVGVNGMKSLDEAWEAYEPLKRRSEPMRVSLPTGGVYAKALMDECSACEEHFGSTNWVLEQERLTPQELDSGLLGSRRQAPANLTPSQFPGTLINLQNAPAAPAPSGLTDAFNAVTNANAFRDMAGLAGTQANALAALQAGADLAKTFGNLGAMQMNAEREAFERIENSNLPQKDKDELKKPRPNPLSPPPPPESPSTPDPDLSQVDSMDADEVRFKEQTSGGPVPTKSKEIETKKRKPKSVKGTHDPDAWYYHKRTIKDDRPSGAERFYEYAFVNFGIDDDELAKEHTAGINDLIETLKSDPDMVIIGFSAYASPSGTASYNKKLSDRRIREIEQKLQAAGIPKEKFPFKSDYTYAAVGEDRSLGKYLQESNYPQVPETLKSESGFDRGLLISVSNHANWSNRKTKDWRFRVLYPETTGLDINISGLSDVLKGLLKMGEVEFEAYGIYDGNWGKVNGPLIKGKLRGRLIYAFTLQRDPDLWTEWTPLNLHTELASDETTWDRLSAEFFGGDLDAALTMLVEFNADTQTRSHVQSLSQQLDNSGHFIFRLSDYMSGPASFRFNRTGNAEGLFISAQDKQFNRHSIKELLDAAIRYTSEGTSDLTQKVQDSINKVYDSLNSFPVDLGLGDPPNITLDEDEIAAELDHIRTLFNLNDALALKIAAGKPNPKPNPDPRPDIPQ